MNYIEIFRDCMAGKADRTFAEVMITRQLMQFQTAGNRQQAAKASLCLTYFKRYAAYNNNKISAKDLILFIRDFVLYIGRMPFPKLVTDAVKREGRALGVYVAPDGAVSAYDHIPAGLEKSRNLIRDVYRLGEGEPDAHPGSLGDAYIRRLTVFNSYRSLEQKLAVHSALELPDDHTLLVSLPTGSGKSLITQLLAAYEPKLTVVVVPTVSLAKDQLLQAVSCISDEEVSRYFFCFESGADGKLLNRALLDSLRSRTARLIFTSPEAILKNIAFRDALTEAVQTGYLHNVVIDEAHIVPDWGKKFRPDFQIFSVVLQEWRALSGRSIRTYLLSATLSDDVVDVLLELFGSGGNTLTFRCDSLRAEPRYMLCRYQSYTAREQAVIEMVKYLPKPLIVYVIDPGAARHYQELLHKEGFLNVFTYTGETGGQDRGELLRKWKDNAIDIMIATSAFGMGVDKGNVRTVLHACVPEGLSRFYQEVGRGGRDGLPSLSVIACYSGMDQRKSDLSEAFGLVSGDVLREDNLIDRFRSILRSEQNTVEGDLVTADLNTVPASFSDEQALHAGKQNMSWNLNALLLLHRQNYIHIETAGYQPEQQSYLVTFRLLIDPDMLEQLQPLSEKLSADRQKEYDMQVDGYKKIASMIHAGHPKCWGHHFVSLFPYAKPICSGCPVHPDGAGIREDRIRIRQRSDLMLPPDPPDPLLQRYMGRVYTDLLVPVESYGAVDTQKLAEAADRLGLAALVFPDDVPLPQTTDCMAFTHSEFLVVAEQTPWLVRNGLLILLCDDSYRSNCIFEAAVSERLSGFRKIWCCKMNTVIESRNRTVNEFLNGRIRDINSL